MTATRTRATASKKKPAAKRAPAPEVEPVEVPDDAAQVGEVSEDDGPIAEDGSIRPVTIGKRGRAGVKLVTIFTINDVPYQVPERLGPAAVIKFQKDLRRKGKDFAVWELVTTLLGMDALDALAECPDVSDEDVADVFGIVSHLAFGSLAKLREAADPS